MKKIIALVLLLSLTLTACSKSADYAAEALLKTDYGYILPTLTYGMTIEEAEKEFPQGKKELSGGSSPFQILRVPSVTLLEETWELQLWFDKGKTLSSCEFVRTGADLSQAYEKATRELGQQYPLTQTPPVESLLLRTGESFQTQTTYESRLSLEKETALRVSAYEKENGKITRIAVSLSLL